MKYQNLAKEVLENIGGVRNIKHVEHCATRLRIHYKDKYLVNEEAIKNLEYVNGVISRTGQLQIIIGPNVHEAYIDFLEISKFEEVDGQETSENTNDKESNDEKKNAMFYVTKFGNFSAAIFMPVIPALITGGLILSIRTLLVNYFGFSMDGGTANLLNAIFVAGFSYLPVYIGYTTAKRLKLEPIMGAFLGALMVSPLVSESSGLDFLGIPIPEINYGFSIIPVILGVFFMYYVDLGLKKVLPEVLNYFLKPLLLMIVVVPVTLIILGPLGTNLSTYVGNSIVWMMETAGFIALPIICVFWPYMVMLGLDKATAPIGATAIASLGYDPVTVVAGFISNLCIGATALAVATSMKGSKEKKGGTLSFAITALCGVTEPAFYGALITRPKVLIGTAIGAACGGLVAGVFVLKSYILGGVPGLLTALYFLPQDGALGNLILAVIVALISIIVSFVATKIVISKTYPEGVE